MQYDLQQMRLALRVLAALNQKTHPDPDEVAQLCRFAPELSNAEVDELACEVVTRLIWRRLSAAGGNCPESDRLAQALRVATHEAEWSLREESRIVAELPPRRAPEFRRIVQEAEERRRSAAQEYVRHVCQHGCRRRQRSSQQQSG